MKLNQLQFHTRSWINKRVETLTRVFSCMSDEGGGDRERHAAQVTLVRLLSRVASLVIGQCAGLSERLAADVTHVWFFPAVKSVEQKLIRVDSFTGFISTLNLLGVCLNTFNIANKLLFTCKSFT